MGFGFVCAWGWGFKISRRISEKKFIFKMGNEHSVAYLVYKV